MLVVAYFFPWFSAIGSVYMPGFSITSNGISPGMLGMFLKGFYRLLMVLIIIITACGAIILYQNITGNQKFARYYKISHTLPAVIIIGGLVILYFKMKPDTPAISDEYGAYGEAMKNMTRSINSMAPGVFDVVIIGVYLSLIAAVYLLLVNLGKIKDKEYYTPAAASNTDNNDTPAKPV